MLISRIFFTICSFAIIYSPCFSQQDTTSHFDKMDKAFEQLMGQMNQSYQTKSDAMDKAYKAHSERMNKAFQEFLLQDFVLVEQTEPKPRQKEVPKPIIQPKLDVNLATVIPKVPIQLKEVPLVVPEQETSNPIAPLLSEAQEVPEYNSSIDFFGHQAELYVDEAMSKLGLTSVSEKGFATYWEEFTATNYQAYIASLKRFADRSNCNDWGIYKMIELSAQKHFSRKNDQNIWMWAMLNQAGYRVKIGYNNKHLFIMVPVLQEVFEKPYYKIDGSNYYLLNDNSPKQKLYTYTEHFGAASKKIDLHLPHSLNFNEEKDFISKTTQLPGEALPLEIKVDKTLIDFLASYPQTETAVYLDAAMSNNIKTSLNEAIASATNGMTDVEIVSWLMNYLHNSFEYQTDREQFGKEKMFFPDELFFYPYSDCEDRTVLFTRLVVDLCGLDAVALTWFNHMAAAVAFEEPVEGYNFESDGKTFTICDPTYQNAPIGAVMPKYEGYQPVVVQLKRRSSSNNIWLSINKTLEHNNNGKLFISERSVAENGHHLVSGWFKGTVNIVDKKHSSFGETRDLWLASFNPLGELNWFQPLACSGYAHHLAFKAGKKGNAYALINYGGVLELGESSIAESDYPTYLILGLNAEQKIILNKNIELDKVEGQKMAFYGKYDCSGKEMDFLILPTKYVPFDSEITIDSDNNIVVRGVAGTIEGMSNEVRIFSSDAVFDPIGQIESYTKEYRNNKVDTKMAGLFASIKLLSHNGGCIEGADVKQLIDENNPGFSKANPGIYESLSKMKFVINEGGIIKIETERGKSISLDAMKIKNNANMRIIKTSEHSYKLQFLNGVEVGKAFIWYTLNSILLHHDGQLVFDYDDDHTKKHMSINDIIDV